MADFKFKCPKCQQPLAAPQDMLGETINCPSCQVEITLPCLQPQQPPRLQPQSQPKPPPVSPVKNNKLFSCPDCGNTISSQAETCPSCGRRFKHVQTPGGILGAILLALFIFGFIMMMMI